MLDALYDIKFLPTLEEWFDIQKLIITEKVWR